MFRYMETGMLFLQRNILMKTKKYLSSIGRIVTGKNQQKQIAHLEQQQKQIAAISRLIEHGWLLIDMSAGVVGVDPFLHTYYQQSIQGDDTKLYRGFCQMLRLWINFQRAFKKGELLHMLEEGVYDEITTKELAEMTNHKPFFTKTKEDKEPPSLPSSEMKIDERRAWLEKYINQRYGNFADAEPLQIIVIGSKGQPIVKVIEISQEQKINFINLQETFKE